LSGSAYPDKKGQGGGRSIVRRITAQQVGEQISLVILMDFILAAALTVFILIRLCETSVWLLAAGTPGTARVPDISQSQPEAYFPYDIQPYDMQPYDMQPYDMQQLNAGLRPVAGQPVKTEGPPNAAQPPNVLYDGYIINRGTAEPEGLHISYAPLTAFLQTPGGVHIGLDFTTLSNISLRGQWADVSSSFMLPAGDGIYDVVEYTHNTLFFAVFRGFSVLLIIQALVIFRRSFTIRGRVRRTLKPITELTLATQNINAQAAGAHVKGSQNASAQAAGAYVKATQNASAQADHTQGKPAYGAITPDRGDSTGGPSGSPPGGPELFSGAIDTINTITERHLDRRISIEDERVELKGLASAINGMLDRLDAAYNAQLRFVSDASHELRTPISVIQGYVNLLDRWGKNDERTLQESIDAIKNEADSMKELIEQLLFLARGDNQSLSFTMEEVDISALVEEVVREAKMIDETHEFHVRTEEGLFINGDYLLLKQALRILNDNSVKFTPPGGRISFAAARSDDRPGNIEITVRDSGVGIPEESLPHIFERFYRADSSRARSSGGTGLGLSIAKWIVDSHHGVIEVVSRKDAGTKIILSFPSQFTRS